MRTGNGPSAEKGKALRRGVGSAGKTGRAAPAGRAAPEKAGRGGGTPHGREIRTADVKPGKARSRKKRKSGSAGRLFLRNSKENKLSMYLAASVVVILLVAVGVNGISLGRHMRENRIRMEEVQKEIRAEEQRAVDIEAYRQYTETDAYIEEIAREKLGLVYEGETVFKEEK